jgi:hypothetical protein
MTTLTMTTLMMKVVLASQTLPQWQRLLQLLPATFADLAPSLLPQRQVLLIDFRPLLSCTDLRL